MLSETMSDATGRPLSQIDLERALADGRVNRSDLAADERPPGGPLAPHLGPRFPLAEVGHGDNYCEDEWVHRFVRAYPLPELAGLEVEAPDDGPALNAALLSALAHLLPVFDWRFTPESRELTGALRKYGIIHGTLLAPQDETTGQAMELEIAGTLVRAGAELARGGDWNFFNYRNALEEDYWEVPLPAPLVIRLQAGVYANVAHSGIGMPFYL